jgi:hypothetical protein
MFCIFFSSSNQHGNSCGCCSSYFTIALRLLSVLSANTFDIDNNVDIDNDIDLVQPTAEEDDKARLSAKKYFFVVNDDEVIDPTNKAGLLDLEISFLAGLVKVDTMLGRVNEPPRDSTVNVFTRLNGPDATVVADRDIFADGAYLYSFYSATPTYITTTHHLHCLSIFLLDMCFDMT